MISVREYVQFISEHKLTQAEFLFIVFVHNQDTLYDVTEEYIKEVMRGELLPKSMINDLIADKWITQVADPATKLSDYRTTDKVIKHLLFLYEDSNEFWNTYPPMIVSAGRNMPLTIMDKNVFRKKYGELTRYSKKEHTELMEDLRYAIDNGYLNMKIENFLSSEYYLTMRKLRKQDDGTNVESVKSGGGHDF